MNEVRNDLVAFAVELWCRDNRIGFFDWKIKEGFLYFKDDKDRENFVAENPDFELPVI